ncbi:MAG: ribonuclease HII [Candidatus Saccharimonadales bacterium]
MIIGIDEVGRGCWAGPLVAAAVGFETDLTVDGLTDSKLLSAKKRRALVVIIKNSTNSIGLGWVWPREINTLGLTESVRLAMQRAVDAIDLNNNQIVIDGSINYLAHIPNTEAIIKADGSIQAVSAASVIAKVARDEYMAKIAEKYPLYGFEKHVGYGTKQHLAALREHGILPIHRVHYKPIKQFVVDSQ